MVAFPFVQQVRDASRLPEKSATAWIGITVLLVSYGIGFTALRHAASLWTLASMFSLWFPAAGLRFALLWRLGLKWAPAAALAELAAQMLSGTNSFQPSPVLATIGIVGPCLVYGLVIHFVRARFDASAPVLGSEPLPFALAALIAPLAASFAALAWALPRSLAGGTFDGEMLMTSLLVFTLGDILGVLFVAPLVLWLTDRIAGRRSWIPPMPEEALLVEVGIVNALAWALVFAIRHAGLGLILAPPLLAVCWTGLRTGRGGSWVAILVAAVIVLPLTGADISDADRLRLHMNLAAIAAIGFLAGSFAEAEVLAHQEIARRDRFLYHAERLKTLRGMSVAVIHEISQPISTIAIEARNLAELADAPADNSADIARTARLIARKSDDMADLVRRLRRFGDRDAQAPSPIPANFLLAEIGEIVRPEAAVRNVVIEFTGWCDAYILGQDIELRQALLNLVRNAIAAAPERSSVSIEASQTSDRVLFTIANGIMAPASLRSGMGIGLVIARSIAEAHGGTIRQDIAEDGRVRFTLDLPRIGDMT